MHLGIVPIKLCNWKDAVMTFNINQDCIIGHFDKIILICVF